MDPEQLRYWIAIAVGIPLMVIFLIAVTVLCIIAGFGNAPRGVRAAAVASFCLAFASTLANTLLLALRPSWYSGWVSHLCMIALGIAFVLALSCLIWRKAPPPTPEARRITMAFVAFIMVMNSLSYLGNHLLPVWGNTVLLVLYGALLAVACVALHRSQRAWPKSSSPSAI